MSRTRQRDFFGRRVAGGVSFYPYQIALGVSLRYWPCLFMPSVRVHVGPVKVWFGFAVADVTEETDPLTDPNIGQSYFAGLDEHQSGPPLGWHVISGEQLLAMLRRVYEGEEPDAVYAEEYANTEREEGSCVSIDTVRRAATEELAQFWEASALIAAGRRLPADRMHAERSKAAVFRTCANELRSLLTALDAAEEGTA